MANLELSGNENPEPPVISSQPLEWQSLYVAEYRELSGSMEALAKNDTTVVLSLSSQPVQIHQRIGSHRYIGLYRQGDLCITPGGTDSAYQAEGSDHYLYTQISANLLEQVAEETWEVEPNQLELIPVLQTRNPQLEKLLQLLQAELSQKGRMGQLYIESLANALAVNLLQDYSATHPPVTQYEGGLGNRKLLRVTRYIDGALDQNIKLAELAQLAEMSQSHFGRLFKQSMGISPHRYLLQQRIERAKRLLTETNQSLAEVALACGFDSHSHFSKQFRQTTGMTPKTYRVR